MIARLLARLGASRWTRAALRCGLIVTAVLLFLLSLRRFGERTGRLLEIETNGAQREMLGPRLAALAIVASLLAAGATDGSKPGAAATCPPVVDYSAEFQARAAAEVEILPANSPLAEMLSDYAVVRDQARVCSGHANR